MAVKVRCKNCNSSFSVKDEFIGKKGKCPKCESIIEINNSIEVDEPIVKGTNIKKKKESRLGFVLLLGLAIGAFFLTGISPGFLLLAGGALFLFIYDLYKQKKK